MSKNSGYNRPCPQSETQGLCVGCRHNSFACSELLIIDPRSAQSSLSSALLTLDPKSSSHQPQTNTWAIYTACHTEPHKAPCLSWSGSCCCRRTQSTKSGHPSSSSDQVSTPATNPPESESSALTDRRSADGKLC
ncbi:hypothetical protein Dimus_038083 [Dionaea muscipula]